MKENERRDGLRVEVARVRAKANSLRDKIKDAQTKTAVVPIFHTLDDLVSFWLGGSETHEPWWYDWAEVWVRWADAKVDEKDAELNPPGGPPKVLRGWPSG